MLETIANIASILASISIFVAIVSLVREMKSQNLQSFFYLHSYLSQQVFSTSRKRVRTVLHNLPYCEWTDEDHTCANSVCTSYDQTGLLFNTRAIDRRTQEQFLKSSWGQSVIDQYEILTPFLDDKQTPELTGREFFVHFSKLYEYAKKYHR